jgi:hypothetical protein
MNLAPELKWLTLASEASSRQAGLQRCGPRKAATCRIITMGYRGWTGTPARS